MNVKKRGSSASPRAIRLALRSFAMDASEEELDEALVSEGEDPDELTARADAVIASALAAASESDQSQASRPALSSNEALALHKGLSTLIQLLRRRERLSEEELAEAARVDANEIRRIEFDEHYTPSPRTIYQLEEHFRLPERTLVLLSGAVTSRSTQFTEEVLRFAAHSKDIGKLSREEKHLLNRFVRFLAKERTRRE